MKQTIVCCLLAAIGVLTVSAQGIYDIKVKDDTGKDVALADYKGRVLLIVNTATRCGFTPQYKELEALYEKYRSQGLEILDFPCNQFGQQAPGTIQEIKQFCTANFNTQFPQFDKIDVNGAAESPLYTYLKAQQGFGGFDLNDQKGKMMDAMMRKRDADYDKKSDIKWNFTKFLVSRDGRVVKRYEPTESIAGIEADVCNELAATACKASKDCCQVDMFLTKSGKSVKFHALMHASIRIVYDGKEIEIDPVTKLGDRTTDYTAMPKADYILVTHEHVDHFDRQAIKLLTGDKTKLVTNRRCADMLGYGNAMANGDSQKLAGDITVEAVPAYNTTEGHLQFHPKGRDNGYILTIDGLRIYIAGDTEDIPEMAAIKDIDIAFLPCNQPYTMTPDQLLKAARMVKPKVLFPYHYGRTDVSTIPSQLKADGIDVRIRQYE